MPARNVLNQIKEKFEPSILRVDIPSDNRLYLYVTPGVVLDLCTYVFRDLDARYVVSIGIDDRPYSGQFTVAHNFGFEKDKVLCQYHGEPPGR